MELIKERSMKPLAAEQIRDAVAKARMPDKTKKALLKQALEYSDPGALIAVHGLYVRQQREASAA